MVPDFELPSTRITVDPPRGDAYPPDRFFERTLGISFTKLFVALAFFATALDYAIFGLPETGIPYNYPLFGGLLYIVAVLLVLRRYHAIFVNTKQELADILARTSADDAVFERDTEITPGEIQADIESVMAKAFHPVTILLGGFVGGAFSLTVMWLLDAFQYFPHLSMNYAYGAGHGFFYGPILGSVYLIHRISSAYIVDIDILDPDGVGGYGNIGDAIIDLIIYGIFLVTLDFVILSSVTFVDEPRFQTAVFALYALMLVFLLGLTVFGVVSIRKRLLEIRERKTRRMREEFKSIEERYWRKLDEGVSPKPESEHIETMDTMFRRLHNMELWPINLASLSRLALSAGSSAAIALYKAGYVQVPL